MYLVGTTQKLQIVTSAAVTVDIHAAYIDRDVSTGQTAPGVLNTLVSTATTTDIVAAPGNATTTRMVKDLLIRNRHASTATDVTILILDSAGNDPELFKMNLAAGQTLEWHDNGVGWFVPAVTSKLFRNLRVTADVVNATTSFADVTGMTMAVDSGKHYVFTAYLFHVNNATTTGSQFAINGPTMTAMRVSAISTVTGSATAAVMSAPVADITTRDAAIVVQTTGPANVVQSIISGWINPSAAGTFAVRCASEVAVAAGITVKAGSYLQIGEADN